MSLILREVIVKAGNIEIVKNVSLEIERGKIHVLMGPNGSGKSSLAQGLMGNPKYMVSGKIEMDGVDLSLLKVDERARKGLFLSFQHPVAIAGVSMSSFLRAAYSSMTGKQVDVVEFYELLKEKLAMLEIESGFSRRAVNEALSGGEKKKSEILQLAVLEPKYAILDECDSGLDVDAIKIVGEGIKKIVKIANTGVLLITHYNRILKYVSPDKVSIIVDGQIVKTGGRELAEQIEAGGFEIFAKDANITKEALK